MRKPLALLVLFMACQRPNTEQREKAVAPISVPSRPPDTTPNKTPTTTQSAPAPSTTPTPETTSAPSTMAATQAAHAESAPRAGEEYFIEGGHPNPKVEEQLICAPSFPEDKDETCKVTLKTTSLFSCLCIKSEDTGDRTGDVHLSNNAKTYLIEGDTVRRLTLKDLFAPEAKIDERQFNTHGSVDPGDYSASDSFVISIQKGLTISFYKDEISDYSGLSEDTGQSISGQELTRLLRPNNPLSVLERAIPLPQDFGAPAPSSLSVVPLEKNPEPTSMPTVGELQSGFHWLDTNGENTALLLVQKSTSKDNLKTTTNLYINHYIKKDGVTTKLISVFDKQEKCEKPNNLAGFVADSARITDVDRDGVGELSFTYELGCVDDPSEVHPVKTFLVEGGAKYALRGDSSGAYKKDKTLTIAPQIFTTYLEWLSSQTKK